MTAVLRPASLFGFFLALVAAFGGRAHAQPQANGAAEARYEVLAVDVEGAADEETGAFVAQASGLRVGQRVALPYDLAFGDAVRRLHALGMFSDVEVVADRMAGPGVFLSIRVTEEPRLGLVEVVGADETVPASTSDGEDARTLQIGGADSADVALSPSRPVSKSERGEIEERLAVVLLRGRPLMPSAVERGRQIILDFYRERGFLQSAVAAEQRTGEDGRVVVTYRVVRGDRLEVADVRFRGNEAFSERALRKRLKNTPEDRWWRFWGRSSFNRQKFESEDLASLVTYYQDRGYYGARVVADTFYVDPVVRGGKPGIVVEVEVEEGPRYAVRNVEFEGNTIYSDDELRQALGFRRGEWFSRSRLEKNLYYTPEHTDVASLYTDRGHLRFNVQETIVEAPGDSLDLLFEVEEGDVYEFGDIAIAGNTRTKDHVVRRELRTVPGETYSRQALERSVRELIQLNYFDQTTLGAGPDTRVDEEGRSVDLTYNLTETSSDQLELSGGWGGASGLILQAGVTFNNFSAQNIFNPSAWRPLPAGDGQQLSLRVQTTGRRYQNYSLSFTEPWFRGRQTPVGFSLGYSSFRGYRSTDSTHVGSAYGRVFYRQDLRWPDDFFQTGTDLGLRLYDIDGTSASTSYGLPEGQSRELTVRQSLSRNSLNNPLFPTAGSSFSLGVTVAPPIPGFVQYHKWDLANAWYAPLSGRTALSVRTQFGYIGSLTGDDVQFQRYLVGGSPLDTQGSFRGFGKDLVYLRGYPLQSIGPRREGEPVGGRILQKYSTELSLVALQTPQLSLAPYLFAEAGNAYDSFADFDPLRLYRSAGVGARIFLPILGMVDLNYGYQIDPFPALPGDSFEDSRPQWRFQFSLGGQ